jgi:hypothetical protein
MAVLERSDAGEEAHAKPPGDVDISRVTPEMMSGKDVRPEWPALTGRDSILLDGISADDIGGDTYARFRSYLFDAGFVPVRRKIADHRQRHLIYTRSASLSDASLAGASFRDSVSMTSLGGQGRFANQLWQYLFLRMYGLRNGLAVKVPAWEGERVFGFSDPRPDGGGSRPSMTFLGSGDDDLELWEIDDAPRDVDFKGYFQNLPRQWGAHRTFIRKLYALKPEWRGAIERLPRLLRPQDSQAEGRTLVSIHVRRGDYLIYDHDKRPEFRPVPTDWYRALLDQIWPGLQRPVLHVATDEPEAIKPVFADYEQFDAAFFTGDFGIPEHVRDFVLLQEADILVACNSSFSTMAAVAGKPGQTCWLADFRAQGFTPYDPWAEPSFCARFVPDRRSLTFDGYGVRAARRRSLMMRYLVARHPELQRDMDRLAKGLHSLEGGKGGPMRRYFNRLWRAVRGR